MAPASELMARVLARPGAPSTSRWPEIGEQGDHQALTESRLADDAVVEVVEQGVQLFAG